MTDAYDIEQLAADLADATGMPYREALDCVCTQLVGLHPPLVYRQPARNRGKREAMRRIVAWLRHARPYPGGVRVK